MKKAFTLVELIVVIGIIGILIGVLLASFSGSSASARAAKCLSNMRNLAQACQTYGAADTTWHRYPAAGSLEYMDVDESDRTRPKVVYKEIKGWISWNSQGAYQGNDTQSHKASASWMTSMYSDNVEERQFCLTNGALWKYVGGNSKAYVCPLHVTKMTKGKGLPPAWSYLMNSVFGWDYSRGAKTVGDVRKVFGDLDRADKILLFSEVPFSGIGSWQPEGSGASTDCDCVLQFNGSIVGNSSPMVRGQECIGANHIVGRNLFAHVAFADGHAEKLTIPFSGSNKAPEVNDSDLRNLTAWLCSGIDVSFDGRHYRKLDN